MKMRTGAFAFLDCLGFKGIWERIDPELVLRKLVEINEHYILESAKATASFALIKSGLIRMKIACISDSIAISLTFDETVKREPDVGDFHLVGAISMIVTTIMDKYLVNEPHLLLRGCVTFGRHAIEKNFIIGPAVDEAVEFESKADGSFVWFTRKADELLKKFDDHIKLFSVEGYDDESSVEFVTEQELQQLRATKKILGKFGPPPSVIRDYSMPITKGRPNIECSIMNPLATSTSRQELEERIQIYQTAMISDREDVKRKLRNTESFLHQCKETTEQFRLSVAEYLVNLGNTI